MRSRLPAGRARGTLRRPQPVELAQNVRLLARESLVAPLEPRWHQSRGAHRRCRAPGVGGLSASSDATTVRWQTGGWRVAPATLGHGQSHVPAFAKRHRPETASCQSASRTCAGQAGTDSVASGPPASCPPPSSEQSMPGRNPNQRWEGEVRNISLCLFFGSTKFSGSAPLSFTLRGGEGRSRG